MFSKDTYKNYVCLRKNCFHIGLNEPAIEKKVQACKSEFI